jgi:hypothetical protein
MPLGMHISRIPEEGLSLHVQRPFFTALELTRDLLKTKAKCSPGDKVGIILFGVNSRDGQECDGKVRACLAEYVGDGVPLAG